MCELCANRNRSGLAYKGVTVMRHQVTVENPDGELVILNDVPLTTEKDPHTLIMERFSVN